jgi:hypothetical protein
METEFKVGDICMAFGMRCVVEDIDKSPSDYPVNVVFEFSEKKESFTPNGRLYGWHKEPSLKLIERPKRKVKKRFYMMVYKCEGGWHQASIMVDENFKDSSGTEHLNRFERKILENSPYLELDLEL